LPAQNEEHPPEQHVSPTPADGPVHAPGNGNTALGIDIGGTGVKLAGMRGNSVLWTAKRSYRKPDVDDLVNAIRDGLCGRTEPLGCVGLCVPGLLDEARTRVTLSVNVPALMTIALHELIARALPNAPARIRVVNDSVASGYDIFATRKLSGRLLVLALGTGVGAAVLDDGKPLWVDGESPGHVGQFDVSVEGYPSIGPDGGAGSLEGYIGAAALREHYGSDPSSKIHADDVPILALARAIRICHAIYRPHHVVLAGGLGIRLGRVLPGLRKHVETHLTSVARPGWTLDVGDSDFHAACGAAGLAMRAG
jgi:predicted NBD/HSP70 family sugar kinase